jgi:two-component system phosphate regulon sensor histidine kinase PhoR
VNLVSNAINYTPKQKTIRIETKGDSQALTVRVIDEGMGIASEDVPRVFDRFFRASKARDSLETGTGLGLAITKEIVELHEGSVSVTSEIGLGSTFTIQLPLNK